MNVREALESLSTPEERERLRQARLSGVRYELAKIIYRERFGHGVDRLAAQRRRAKNKRAHRQRLVNARHG